VFRLGLAASRRESRQMVAHGHIQVNARKVSVPSYIVRVGETVQLRASSKMQERAADNLGAGRSAVPAWLDLDVNQKKGTVRGLPVREDIQIPVQEQLIVELFSK
jgi:small subunit ribosomal protein S4